MAISIISIVLIAIYKMQAQTIALNNMSRFYSTAPLLANRKLTEITSSRPERSSASGDFGNTFPGYKWSAAISDVESDKLERAVQNLKKIDILITFNEIEFSYRLRTYWTFWE